MNTRLELNNYKIARMHPCTSVKKLTRSWLEANASPNFKSAIYFPFIHKIPYLFSSTLLQHIHRHTTNTHTMLEGKFEEASLFKKIIESIKDSVKICNLNCDEEGLNLQAIDDSRVLLISLFIGKDCFQEYRCDKPMTLGLDLPSLNLILKQGNNEDFLTIIGEPDQDTVLIAFEDKHKERISEFNLKLMDLETELLNVEDMEHDAIVLLASSEFSKICRDMRNLSESLEITVTKDAVKFGAEGSIGRGSVVLKANTDMDKPENTVKIDLSQPVDLKFGSKYLNDIVKSTSLSSSCSLKLSDGAPALFEYKLPSGYLRFYLAPKFEEEEGDN